MSGNRERATEVCHLLDVSGGARDVKEAVVSVALDDAEARGYERGRRDFQFAPEGDNHHNAARCPYCSPDGGT